MNRIHHTGGVPIDPKIGRTAPVGSPAQKSNPAGAAGGATFHDLLQQKLQTAQEIRFSAHAQNRLTSRDIQLTPETVGKLTEAVNRAAGKGARDALVLMPGAARGGDLALVVSVSNRTVITAVDGDHLRDNVFTNIDSAVIAT